MRRLVAALCLLVVPVSAHAAAGDPRGVSGDAIDVHADRQVAPRSPAAVAALRAGLGADAIVSVDGRNGGLRLVGRLDGFLTPPSTADAAAIALGYVRANRAAFGLMTADIDNLVLVRRVTSVGGLQRLFWQQRSADGAPALDSGLRANVTADGRLINIAGSPVSGVGSARTAARLTAGQARVAALDGLGVAALPSVARSRGDLRSPTTFANGDRAALGVSGVTKQPVWDTTVTVDGTHVYRVIVDAATGQTLMRRNLVQSAAALVHRNYPGAPVGGTQTSITMPSSWIAPGATRLIGPNVHSFADLTDDNVAAAGDEIAPSATDTWSFPISTLPSNSGSAPPTACVAPYLCTWDHNDAVATRAVNRNQSGAQVFYFVNTFHDWLAAAPFGFTPANGAFEVTDPVDANILDGVSTGPNNAHINNANMATFPDGQSPRMQMFLFHRVGISYVSDPFLPSNGGDDASIIYHEYTHGLSNRLVVDATGNSTLRSLQSDSMGEAWSDWYAMDYLADGVSCAPSPGVPQPCEPDTAASGELLEGKYVSIGKTEIRYQAIDCAVGAVVAGRCDSPRAGVPAGGFTYGSLGKINGAPEVHADGEIWAQTLWDLRTAIGVDLARNLITRAMEISPDDPSFLDMRNAILQADTAVNGGAARGQIWAVFAHRGMGYFAGTLSAADATPVESFALPPAAAAAKGTLSGIALDFDTHAIVPGTRVAFAGLDSGFPGSAAAVAAANGRYTMPALPAGPYPYLTAGGVAGYERSTVTPFALAAGPRVRDVTTRRGWALASGGGTVQAFTGFDNTLAGCGPKHIIDGSLGSGWSNNPGDSVTIKLPAAISVRGFGIAPGPTCGDPIDSSTAGYTVETSPDNVTFTVAAQGTFTRADVGRLNEILPTAGATGVNYVRITALNNLGPNGGPFVDIQEFSVHGVRPGAAKSLITGPATIQLGATTVFSSAASAGVGGSPIAARKWSVAGIPPSAAVTYGLKGAKLNQKLTMTLAVTDYAGRTGTSSTTVTVIDTLGPVVTIKKVSGKVNRNVTISAKLADPSGLAKTASVKFGDGKSATVTIRNGKLSVKHKFKKAKTFTITVTAKDKLKRSSKTTLKVVIKKP